MIGNRGREPTSIAGTSRLISAGPMISLETPRARFAPARTRSPFRAESVWASVRWPCWENITLNPSVAERSSYSFTLSS